MAQQTARKLGKKEPEFSKRDIRLKSILRPRRLQNATPTAYDFDKEHPGIVYPMFANDQYGDCVIAGRAHQTMRFELLEQKKVLSISDQDVINEYLRQTGGRDSGLVVSRSLKQWRRVGWLVSGSKYTIKAFARIDCKNLNEVRSAIYADVGVGLGFSLPDDWQEELDKGLPWSSTKLPPNPYNGHYVYMPAYGLNDLTCVTWAQRQLMTNEWFLKYVDEAWAVIDAVNLTTEKGRDFINKQKLDAILEQHTEPEPS